MSTGKGSIFWEKEEESGESQERCLGECGEFVGYYGWRETDSFVRMLKRLCLGDLEGCRRLLLVAGVKHEDLFD